MRHVLSSSIANHALVQYLLLTGQYLQGTRRSTQAWVNHGLAVKAALQMGLHTNDTLSTLTLTEREIRKRVWFGCVTLDRTLSMTFGRPATIPDSYVRLPMPTVLPWSPDLTICDQSPVDQEISVAFFTATMLAHDLH